MSWPSARNGSCGSPEPSGWRRRSPRVELPVAESRALGEQNRRTRTSLGRAISIAEQLQTKVEQFPANGKPDEPRRSEIQDLSNRLEGLLGQAEAERSAAEFDALKARIHSGTN